MKNNIYYINAKKAKRQWELRWFAVHIGAVAFLIGSIAIALATGEGTHLLIAVPLGLYLLFTGGDNY